MAVKTRKFGFKQAAAESGVVCLSYYICDTDAEKPTSGLNPGDLAVALDTYKIYFAKDSTTWQEYGAQGAQGAQGPQGDPGADGAGVTAGIVMAFAGSSAPAGWLLCDGAAVSRTTYATLFALIGTTYGAGDGSTTFNVPNLKGRVPVGKDAGQTEFDVLGETGGEKTHQLTSAEMPSHTHTQNAHSHVQQQPGAATGNFASGTRDASSCGTGGSPSALADALSTQTTVAVNQNTGGDGAHNNLQPYIALNYIIKT